jgi:hypothetical protein
VGSEALLSGVISERTMRRLHRPVYPTIYVPRDAVPSEPAELIHDNRRPPDLIVNRCAP